MMSRLTHQIASLLHAEVSNKNAALVECRRAAATTLRTIAHRVTTDNPAAAQSSGLLTSVRWNLLEWCGWCMRSERDVEPVFHLKSSAALGSRNPFARRGCPHWQIFSSLLVAMEDYTIDSHGDVGSGCVTHAHMHAHMHVSSAPGAKDGLQKRSHSISRERRGEGLGRC
jgi:TPP-dependent indolepyruvate ferredoxin oxidoreductase alpha subunit